MLPPQKFQERLDKYESSPTSVEERRITWELLSNIHEELGSISAELHKIANSLGELRDIERALASIAKDIDLKLSSWPTPPE